MRSSFFSRPPLRLTWYVPNLMACSAGTSPSRSGPSGMRGTGLQVLDLQLEPLGEAERGVAALDLARELLLQREDALRARERVERHAPLDDLDQVVGIDVA